jgi:hypothetical protein
MKPIPNNGLEYPHGGLFSANIFSHAVELLLFFFLALLPVMYTVTDGKIVILLVVIELVAMLFFLLRRIRPWRGLLPQHIILSFIFMFLFDFAEKGALARQWTMTMGEGKEIPFTTILLSFVLLARLGEVLNIGAINVERHSFTGYFLLSSAFLVVLTLLFYPLLISHYDFTGGGVQLINKIMKYVGIFWVFAGYSGSEGKLRRFSLGAAASAGLLMMVYFFYS